MSNLSGWDWAILLVASYVAVVSLARLMRRHHDLLVVRLREQAERHGEAARRRKQRTGGPSTAPDDRQKTGAA
jgi:hypothetical protein